MTFHGHVDESVLPDVFRTFDVLAVPSVPVPGWLEQFGRVVVEAQAAGVPSVASASGALPDVVGDAGLLGPAGRPGRAVPGHCPGSGPARALVSAARTRGLDTVDRYSWAERGRTPAGSLRPGRPPGLSGRRRPTDAVSGLETGRGGGPTE